MVLKGLVLRVLSAAKKHKFIAIAVAALVLWGAYAAYAAFANPPAQARYVIGSAQKGTLVVSVSGTGQVAASNQVDVKPKVSADVVSVRVKQGDSVKAGQTLASLDATNAAATVQNAETDLQSVQLSLQKLQEPATALTLTQASDALVQASQALQAAQNTLAKDYVGGFNSVASTFIDLPGLMSGLNSVESGTGVSQTQGNFYAYYDLIKNYAPTAQQFRDAALASYAAANDSYSKTLVEYQHTNLSSTSTAINALISDTYTTTQAASQAVKDAKTFLDLVTDTYNTFMPLAKPPSALATHESNVQSYTTTVTGHLNDLLAASHGIASDQSQVVADEQSITEKQYALANLKAGADPLDVQSQQLAITQKQNALDQAQANLAYYTVRAPFDGVVAAVDVKPGDSASTGAAAFTLISKDQIANISMNEVDVAKVAIGDKATLSFDAIPGLAIAGQVAAIDSIGTVSQGVVNYNVQIAFDTQDTRVKPGMSVSAAIITATHTDALLVPNGAVKAQGGNSYVQVIAGAAAGATVTSASAPTLTPVQVGLSNDSMTEILSGISEGQPVVTQVIGGSASVSTQSASAGLRILGGAGAGSGFGGGGGTRTGGTAGR